MQFPNEPATMQPLQQNNTESQTSSQRPTGLNMERLFNHRTIMPSLIGYVDSIWKDISVTQ